MSPRKDASVLMRALIMRTAPKNCGPRISDQENFGPNFGPGGFSLMNPLAHLFMICSNIKLTEPEESTRIGFQEIY